jgi:hypothetical protein
MTFLTQETSRNLGKPFQLFLFRSGDTNYRYTTADHSIFVDTLEYVADQPMESVEIRETLVDNKGKLNFKVMRNHEIANLFLISNPRTISMTIFAGHEDDPNDEIIILWTGRVVACDWDEDDQAVISCESATTVLSRNGLPYKFGGTCQHTLYRGGCGLDMFANSALYDLTSYSGYDMVFTDLIGLPANDYDAGLVVVNGVDYRMITAFDSDTGTLTLLRPFESVSVGESVRVARGCNRTSDRCIELNNFEHYLGFDTVPNRNPFEGLKQAEVQREQDTQDRIFRWLGGL